MGKYIRHFIAVVIGLLVASMVQVIGTRLGITLEEEQVKGFTEALTNAITPAVTIWFYAWSEKYLKRFSWLDHEGYVSRSLQKNNAEHYSKEELQ